MVILNSYVVMIPNDSVIYPDKLGLPASHVELLPLACLKDIWSHQADQLVTRIHRKTFGWCQTVVGGDWNMFDCICFFHSVGNFTIPTGEIIFFWGVVMYTTNQNSCANWLQLDAMCQIRWSFSHRECQSYVQSRALAPGKVPAVREVSFGRFGHQRLGSRWTEIVEILPRRPETWLSCFRSTITRIYREHICFNI